MLYTLVGYVFLKTFWNINNNGSPIKLKYMFVLSLIVLYKFNTICASLANNLIHNTTYKELNRALSFVPPNNN